MRNAYPPGGSPKAFGLEAGWILVTGRSLFTRQTIPKLRLRLPPVLIDPIGFEIIDAGNTEKKEKHETKGCGEGDKGRGQVVRRPITVRRGSPKSAQERAEIMKAKPKRSCHDYFDDEVEAARAWDRKARELFGEYAWLNLPPEDPPEQGQ